MFPLPCPALALAASALLHLAGGTSEGLLLDRVTTSYLEDAEIPRPVAQITAELLRSGSTTRLRLFVSAEGAGVEPQAGLSGVHGHNLRTAEELHRLLRDGLLEFEVRGPGGEPRPGTVRVTRSGSLPVRTVGPGGELRLHDRTSAEWPLEVAFESGGLTEEDRFGYVLAEGVPRLRVEFDLSSIVEVMSLGQFLVEEGGR